MTLALKLRSARAENLSLDKTTTLYFSVLDLLSTFQHPSRVDHIANLILLLIFHHYLRTVAGECSQASDLDGQCPNYLIGSASTGCWGWCENCENCKNNLVWSMTNVNNSGCGQSTGDVEVDARCKTDNYSVILHLLWTHSLPQHVCQTNAISITDFCLWQRCSRRLLASQNSMNKFDREERNLTWKKRLTDCKTPVLYLLIWFYNVFLTVGINLTNTLT